MKAFSYLCWLLVVPTLHFLWYICELPSFLARLVVCSKWPSPCVRRNSLPVCVGVHASLYVFYECSLRECTAKSGVSPTACLDLVQHVVAACPHLNFRGLMSIGRPNPPPSQPDFVVDSSVVLMWRAFKAKFEFRIRARMQLVFILSYWKLTYQ